MGGTKIGGARAAATNKAKYGKDFYIRIGAMGGRISRTGGFYARPDIASSAGRKGGLATADQYKRTSKQQLVKKSTPARKDG